MSDELCRLCSTPNTNSHLNIFSVHGIEIGMVDILSEHFKCDISEADPLPNVVCAVCWAITTAFHELYKKSKEVQGKLLNSLVKIEHDPIDAELPSSNSECSLLIEEVIPIKSEQRADDNESSDTNDTREINADRNKADGKSAHENVSRNVHQSKSRNVTARKQKQSKNSSHREIGMDKGKVFHCDICKETFYSQPKLLYHKKKHEKQAYDKKIYEFVAENFDMTCDFCEREFTSFQDARQHYKECHNEDKGWIKCCRTKLKSFTLIRDHIRAHSNPESFKCELCNKCFSSQMILVQHRRRHRLATQRLICHFCAKGFPNKNSITRHLFTKHVDSEPKFECEIPNCRKKFQLQSLLKSHNRTVHQQKKATVICEVCGQSFYGGKFFLDKHMVTAHTDKSERVAISKPCEHCGELMMTKSGEFYHKQLHTTGVQKCECGMELPNRPTLLRHIRQYHRAHKFNCSYCEKTFSTASVMRRHEESHTRNKTYDCQWCTNKSFTVRSSLRTHVRRNHQDKLKSKKNSRNLIH